MPRTSTKEKKRAQETSKKGSRTLVGIDGQEEINSGQSPVLNAEGRRQTADINQYQSVSGIFQILHRKAGGRVHGEHLIRFPSLQKESKCEEKSSRCRSEFIWTGLTTAAI